MAATAPDRDARTLRELAADDRLSSSARRLLLAAADLGEDDAALADLADVLDGLRALDPDAMAALLEPPATRVDVAPGLPDAERAVLARIGLEDPNGTDAPVVAGRVVRGRFELSCLDAVAAATRLGVDPSRIRQLLGERRLLGFHATSGRRRWLLPEFQFQLGLVGLDAWTVLLRALPEPDTTSPTALVSWLTRSRDHLGDRSRVQALLDGYPVDHLVAEAGAFGVAA